MRTPHDPLTDLADDVRHLFAAGERAADDHGLRRHAAGVRSLGARVPALAALADAIDRLLAAAADERGRALLDLNVLLRRVRAGLATAGVAGTPEPVDPSGPWTTDLRLDEPVFTSLVPELADPKAKPLNALILADHEEMGTELRLVGPLLAGLGHPDSSAPKRVASVLRHYKGVAAELRREFDPEGGRADAMRLRALGDIDPGAARAACREAIARGSDVVRHEALEVLESIDPAEAERGALALLAAASTSQETRKKAMKTLRVARSDAGLDLLLSLVGAADSAWSPASEALQRCPHPAADARLFGLVRAALAEGHEAGPRRVLRVMAVLIQRRHAEALRLFLSWLDHPTKELRDWARNQVQYLYERGQPVVPELVAALGHEDPKVLLGVMESLTRFGGEAAAATPRLAELLRDKRVGVREKAAVTLGAVGSGPPDAVAALAGALRDESAKVRFAAARALGLVGPAAAAAGPTLTEALGDRQAEVCTAALQALRAIGAAAAEALPAVLALEHHQYASVRHEVLVALPRLGEPGVAEVIARLGDAARCENMMSALSRYAGADPRIVMELTAILRDRAHPKRSHAAAVLGGFRDSAAPAVGALVAALDEDADPLREAVARALSVLSVQAKEVVTPLADAVVPALARAVRNGTYGTRRDSCTALERLGPAAAPAVPALTAALNDPDFIVRGSAREALRAISAAPA